MYFVSSSTCIKRHCRRVTYFPKKDRNIYTTAVSITKCITYANPFHLSLSSSLDFQSLLKTDAAERVNIDIKYDLSLDLPITVTDAFPYCQPFSLSTIQISFLSYFRRTCRLTRMSMAGAKNWMSTCLNVPRERKQRYSWSRLRDILFYDIDSRCRLCLVICHFIAILFRRCLVKNPSSIPLLSWSFGPRTFSPTTIAPLRLWDSFGFKNWESVERFQTIAVKFFEIRQNKQNKSLITESYQRKRLRYSVKFCLSI